MSREEALRELLKNDDAETGERLDRLEKKLDLILSVIVVQQKDACEAVGVSADTARNKVLAGDVEVLQADGSRLNYYTLKETAKLKPRRPAKRRR